MSYSVGTVVSNVLTATGATGAITCTVSPALPSGLAFSANGATCTLSGTPLVAAVSATYTVIATDSASKPVSATTSITFAVGSKYSVIACNINTNILGYFNTFRNPKRNLFELFLTGYTPTSCSWSTVSPITYVAYSAIAPNTLTCAGSPITACTATLPTGLTVVASAGTCLLVGTPTAASAYTGYTVTVSNSAGSTQVLTYITVYYAAVALGSTCTAGVTTACTTGMLPIHLMIILFTLYNYSYNHVKLSAQGLTV